jgi:IS5 family transposase
LNKQLEKHKIIIKTGAIVDASITPSPLKPKGKTTYQITENRSETELSEEAKQGEQRAVKLLKNTPPGVDIEATWVKKAGKLQYVFKKHVVSDYEGMVLGVITTTASLNEICNLEVVLTTADLPEHIALFADKGYASAKNRELLKTRKLKDRILKRAVKGKPLTGREKQFNKLVGKVRYKVERVFASIRRWFSSENARYRGLAKTHTQHLMEAMAYNLYAHRG